MHHLMNGGTGFSGRDRPANRFLNTVLALCAVLVLSAATSAAPPVGDSEPAPSTIRDAKAGLSFEDRSPMRVRGVLTFRIGEGFSIQDQSDGVWIEVTQARREGLLQSDVHTVGSLQPGDEVEVIGKPNRGGYAPNILPVILTKIGERPLPEARPYDRDRFFRGLDDCLRVTVEGIVQGYRDDADNQIWELLVEDCARQFWVGIDKSAFTGNPTAYIDSRIRCVGVASARFNTRSELISPRLNVCQPEDFLVLQPGESDPFAAPEVPLAAIARYPLTSHRIRIKGTLTHAVPRNFVMLQMGNIGVRVDTDSDDRFVPGDVVEASGFVSNVAPVACMVEAVVRKVGGGVSLRPIEINPLEISQINHAAAARYEAAEPGDYFACLVAFPATVLDVHASRVGGEVLLLAEAMGLSAVADILAFTRLRTLPPGTKVHVTGIIQPEIAANDDPAAAQRGLTGSRMQILLRSADDLRIVELPSWWTRRRLMVGLVVVATCAAAATLWIVLLRRQVSRQLGVIERKLQGEAATEERHRIAREFHDTLEQDLAGIELQLDAAADMTDDDRCRPVLHKQRALLARLRQETHDFLWDLRDPVRIDGAIVESLAAQAAYLQSGTSVPITLHANDGISRVPADIQFHLLRIVREAIHNAVRHGDPASVVVNIGTDGTGIAVEVIDDGDGFDVTAKQGLAGHFGLRGMAERAARIGANLAVTSTPGTGTHVRVTVPLAKDGEPTSNRIRFSG
jgi:signal transduction histidine kinase